ncbi:MAG: hypothetical protein HYZ00_03410 [Candidatus Hydrogenedentes bacterium]|nr:hypothetical protein [Candidatus Hydrogenedentota bacterium]
MSSPNRMDFEEVQGFAPWVYVTVAGVMALGFIGAVTAAVAGGEHFGPGDYLLFLVLSLLPTFFVLNLLALRTRIQAGSVRLSLGWLFPIFWRRLPLGEVSDPEIVRYRPLRDAGGWGLRFGRFGGERCQFWNARGDQGVRFHLNGKQYLIGTQQPDQLAAALRGRGAD